MKKLNEPGNRNVILIITAVIALSASCKKKKEEPPPPPDDPEVITTFKLTLTDSASSASKTYVFTDPDGDGGQSAFYGPDKSTQTDSVITLNRNAVYFGQVILMDETKDPDVDLSAEVSNESSEHMLFYNNGNNSILNSGNPYTVKLNESNVVIRYTDLDNGSPQRGLGLTTRWATADSTKNKTLLNIVLRHQPEAKDGTFGPGETDVEVNFRLLVN